jgi:hypothetical protein
MNYVQDNMFLGQLPKRLVIACVDSDALNGTIGNIHSQVALFYKLKCSNFRHVECEIKSKQGVSFGIIFSNTPKYQKRFQRSIRQKQTTQKIKRTFGLDREHGPGRSTGNTLGSPICVSDKIYSGVRIQWSLLLEL